MSELKKQQGDGTNKTFSEISSEIAHWTGRPISFILSLLIIIVWSACGPFFHYSDTWQLVINTGTTIVTFLMVFVIQNTQNRDSAAIQAKLDELIRSSAAQNRFIGIEHLTSDEIDEYRSSCEALARKGQAAINGVGPRVGESGLGLIAGHAYSSPYEDVTLAGK